MKLILLASIGAGSVLGLWLGLASSATNYATAKVIAPVISDGASQLSKIDSLLKQIPTLRYTGANARLNWGKWALEVPDADIPAAVAALDPLRDRPALHLLYARWAKLDFPNAWKSFLASKLPAEDRGWQPSPTAHRGFAGYGGLTDGKGEIASAMLNSFHRADAAAAETVAVSLLEDSEACRRSGLSPWEIKQIRSNAAEWLAPSVPDPDPGGNLLASLQKASSREADNRWHQWCREDSAGAMAWLKQLPAEDRAKFRHYDLIYESDYLPGPDAVQLLLLVDSKEFTSHKDLAAASAELMKAGDYSADHSPEAFRLANAMRRWAQKDSAGALQQVQQMPEGDLRSMLLGQVAGMMTLDHADQAISLVNNATPEAQALALPGMVAGWAGQAPQACFQWLEKISDPAIQQTCWKQVATAWASTEPELALRAAERLSNPNERNQIGQSVFGRLSWNPAECARLREAFPASGK